MKERRSRRTEAQEFYDAEMAKPKHMRLQLIINNALERIETYGNHIKNLENTMAKPNCNELGYDYSRKNLDRIFLLPDEYNLTLARTKDEIKAVEMWRPGRIRKQCKSRARFK